MRRETDLLWYFALALAFAAALYGVFVIVRGPVATPPYLKIVGAGFIYNYRVADIYAGFTAAPGRPIPLGSVLEATFENPGEGNDFIVRHRVGLPDRRIALRSPSMRGVQPEVRYAVVLRLLDRVTEKPFWRHEFTVSSSVGDDLVPNAPLTVGPGYHQPDISTVRSAQ